MKRHGNLWKDIIDLDNLYLAHKNARRGKTHYKEVKLIDQNPEYYMKRLQTQLKWGFFENSEYTIFKKVCGNKIREIYKLPYYPDRIVHHAIMNIIEPIWKNVLIRDTYSAIKNRGIHEGFYRVKKFLRDKPNTKYCLKLDIKKFYPSINHTILKSIIKKKIKCNKTLNLLFKIIDSAKGVPIGNYLSQYFGNLYLTYFDHWVKEVLRIKYYCRYCDDIVILHKSKSELRQIFKDIKQYLITNLDLSIKSNWQIFPINKRGIDFLGYKFYHNYIKVRKSIVKKFKHKVKMINKYIDSKTNTNIINSIMSYYGWFKHSESFGIWFNQLNTRYLISLFTNICQFNQKIRNPHKESLQCI